ncbi:tRNA (adenosine(37)-N6)-threonylcarbamoyltransferase complex dimerization subunit type 1 TsaB [Longibacter salinarum]|uniref:tRNA (Adenosine(37)-N6)-threonylcarbamoyltransferase complex dimerization subunit type 1 TsaB n=1 Tax=Longibacter salinarum TaxID=1850348 RepID=A0A2A8CZZ5_9BACT|nr:tRNA (adenosine(37)-N6)-threonylcarbamoyltransferase complex dimerization subunit type 1 TsaB [Longibacter salinarum]PEN14226.1 tRNA (adenosine(37)-N6)-threonylcarbamoyltransferase complex dimerization subunit type 1 TsaB [Longibacter salinarum]
MVLLAIETATHTCGAAVCVDGNVVAENHMHRPRAHAQHLTPIIEDVLTRASVDHSEIDVVAVSKGPGSYTGLRIGVSTAKGWAEATGADLIGVPTLEALAATVTPHASEGEVVCAALDARRDEVFAAAYRMREVVGDGEKTHPHPWTGRLKLQAAASAMNVKELPDWIGVKKARVRVIGTGAAKVEPVLRSVGIKVRVVPDVVSRPSAAWVARCALEMVGRGQKAEPKTFEPMYLKAFHVG